ncbi:hypothetical protein KQX54_006219 [Cotesia glomerata]|uniref:Uncharacterized protein n=1 Tax=Cotesia glomerata TaxID=32391 RepID=A0AAV7HSP7_COTGL|nr:hypothetical protein KQX54_006219 [Cotesia glomerata]
MSALENATNTTSQKLAVKPDSGSHSSQNASSLKGRRRLADSWDKLNIEVLGNPIELLNNKKRLLESESMDDDISNNPPKRRVALDSATLLELKEGIVEALTAQLLDSSDFNISDEAATLSRMFINTDIEKLKNIYLYVTRALKLRAFCLNI